MIPVLFITYNRIEYTKKTLPALIKNTPGVRIIVIDNGSTDGTVEYLEGIYGIELYLNDKNFGLAHAMNQFLELTATDAIVAKVDNDTVVPPGWLEKMTTAMEESGVDVLQAYHYLTAFDVSSWEDVEAKHTCVETSAGNVVMVPAVGGSGTVFKRNIIMGIFTNDGLNPWWNFQQEIPDVKKGFFAGEWVDLLDMVGHNEFVPNLDNKYYRSTGRFCLFPEDISVVIPVIRPVSAMRCIESVQKYLPGVEIVSEEDKHNLGCPKMVNRLVAKTSRQWVMFLGDDTEIKPGFLRALQYAVESLPKKWGVIGLNTENGIPCAHWIAHKNMLDLTGGQFFSSDYHHFYCDNELMDIAKENERWAWAEKAKIKHNHPSNSAEPDEYNKSVLSNREADRITYYHRKRDRRRGGIAIGFPLVDDRVPVQFFTSFACMDKPEQYTLLVPQFPHGPWTGSIADARNSLVRQALEEGCSHLLMLDTDQVYPADTLTRLLSHKKDICGVRVHRRWAPFDPIFLRGEIGKYISAPDDEMYSGNLIPVDATGTGCLLFDMDVFLRVNPPWFEFGHHNGKPVGEDIKFCSKAREAEVEIFVDTGIAVGHLATVQIDRFFHEVCKKMTCKM